jgi:thioredoxin 1
MTENKETGIDLIQFWASWCGPCKMMKPILDEIAAERWYSFQKIDIDENEKMTEEAWITSVPTVIITVDWEEKARFTWLRSKDDVLSIIDSL